MYCKICGEENDLSSALRYWCPDDGWVVGRLCHSCLPEAKRKPAPTDYAYDQRGEYVADVDDAISTIYG